MSNKQEIEKGCCMSVQEFSLPLAQTPMVSVAMIAYNVGKYLEEAIEGVLLQKTDFLVELIIGEDCSTDNTRKICMNYKLKYPDKIRLLLNEKNKGLMPNFSQTLLACTSKYIALCDGDDYWTDPLKLQKQVDFLEANPNYSIGYHRVYYEYKNGETEVETLNQIHTEQTYTIRDLLKGNKMHTCSVVFRRDYKVLDDLSQANIPIGDYALHLLNARHGLIHYSPEVMATYNLGIGVWSSLNEREMLRKSVVILNFLHKKFSDDKQVANALLKQKLKIKTKLHPYFILLKIAFDIVNFYKPKKRQSGDYA